MSTLINEIQPRQFSLPSLCNNSIVPIYQSYGKIKLPGLKELFQESFFLSQQQQQQQSQSPSIPTPPPSQQSLSPVVQYRDVRAPSLPTPPVSAQPHLTYDNSAQTSPQLQQTQQLQHQLLPLLQQVPINQNSQSQQQTPQQVSQQVQPQHQQPPQMHQMQQIPQVQQMQQIQSIQQVQPQQIQLPQPNYPYQAQQFQQMPTPPFMTNSPSYLYTGPAPAPLAPQIYPLDQYQRVVTPLSSLNQSKGNLKLIPKQASAWSHADDKLLRYLKEEKKLGWRAVATYFPRRTPNACQFRWRRLVSGNASLKNSINSKQKLASKSVKTSIKSLLN
ncbi:SANT/Myb-like DNA-binding domain-containing protein ASCRUDRAFT_7276 [Ascoidea rubescens DSM 1968]|uniref:Uncharacterized protein n=1 Tax=Ascoidea rubescens DSM 1968 TaxID=1344418 RepID=A0A1D2VJK8_9ASCO|nr:hypothetical protein ASCRUDRAFT_7276 [Ascoidea rubescens DSM 1968]ODV61792.1 hypothetical protein ASCRUDRAFT_7276 [Ascoidea rubescens DSM 1968]